MFEQLYILCVDYAVGVFLGVFKLDHGLNLVRRFDLRAVVHDWGVV